MTLCLLSGAVRDHSPARTLSEAGKQGAEALAEPRRPAPLLQVGPPTAGWFGHLVVRPLIVLTAERAQGPGSSPGAAQTRRACRARVENRTVDVSSTATREARKQSVRHSPHRSMS